ncbi:GntR family transcriptional regulator [Bombilactobacillus folatiphilus]|uniref:GntR family transcriptional regulator n=1 Tax=Bombilactobacillus folatiphilus TaxID=2923362 RepID=A0ABY4PB88_9LACO|nr:GntR family transcriptional regulator [Bombilactobacillus folatiphilus]UQS82928.1 GntR family transcriptional regulator [Bombilactobacillus folatiphilus]
MSQPIYVQIAQTIKQNILDQQYSNLKLPDERSLSDNFAVSRSSIKRAVQLLADEGVVFKKQGSGNFINPLFLRRQTALDYTGDNLGLTTSIVTNGKTQQITVLDFDVQKPTIEMQENLFLQADDFVYKFKRLRKLDSTPILIETSYIPVRLWPELSQEILGQSLFNYLEEEKSELINRAYLDMTAEPSTLEDQQLLNLTPQEPVGLMTGIFFRDDGLPFEYSSMRLHYKYWNFSTFVDLSK